jgi:hypothetical protein
MLRLNQPMTKPLNNNNNQLLSHPRLFHLMREESTTRKICSARLLS